MVSYTSFLCDTIKGSNSYCATISLNFFFYSGKDDYLNTIGNEKLRTGVPILLNHHGIEIHSLGNIPDDQEVKVGINIYDASKPEFSFPEGFFIKTCVYQIRIISTHESLINGIQVTLANFPQPQARDRVCVLEASGNPSRWGANLTPEFGFLQVEASRFQCNNGTVNVTLSSSTCYLVVAGE